ncbi:MULTISPECIES: gluconokinase [unclassified Mycolicibacterium]|uniref:gluconokinase n=1 Tax=unclassified Mycolicibacterium TaxID=2636767 RepID=UPI001F4BE6CE|nr:gluconokinase [Mycolicibacterium sp. YH-1]UNB53483.1 gluconokinase [Mycolicibacterium sp. YH-1]HET7740287.1 gluconokinase [Mycobacterium sp.]
MGVSGTGKTTVGMGLATRLNEPFIDADDLHDEPSKTKMARGIPLTDEDRAPWLTRAGQAIEREVRLGASPVLACSSLKAKYRDRIRSFAPTVVFVHLDGTASLIAHRLSERTHEYMPSTLLESQLGALEPLRDDEHGLRVDISMTPGHIIDRVVTWLDGAPFAADERIEEK